jgi:type I restriction enzyme S subunit
MMVNLNAKKADCNWYESPLSTLLVLLKDGTHNPPKRRDTGVPMLSAVNIQNGKIIFDENVSFISEKDYKEMHKNYEIQEGDILLTIVGTLGRVVEVPKIDKKFTVQRSVAILRPNTRLVNPRYLKYYIQSYYFQNQLKIRSNVTAQAGIYLGELGKIPIRFPNLPEQRKIAAILSTVDEAIEKTEAIIEQTEKVKKGLMQQLLTKGIGHTKFKKTEIGEIPEEWEVKRLSEISLINMGQSPSSAVCNDLGEGIPFFQGNAEFGMKHPIPKRWCTEPTKLANKGDILISVRAPVGELNIANQTCCIGRGLAAITPTKINNDYLYFAMQIYKSSLLKVSQGSTFTAINKQDLHNLLLPVPSLIEQKKISAILLSLDSKFEKEKKKLNQLQFMKTGLMQVLLTGKVRVKVDEDEVMSS